MADRLWLAADGHVKPFRGDMDDYARFVLDRAKNSAKDRAKDRAKDGVRASGQVIAAAGSKKKCKAA